MWLLGLAWIKKKIFILLRTKKEKEEERFVDIFEVLKETNKLEAVRVGFIWS